jgi:hypothetical protein
LRLQQGVVGLGVFCDTHQGVAAREVANYNLVAVCKAFGLLSTEGFADEQKYVLYCLADSELPDSIQGSLRIVARQKTINFFSHGVY